MVCQVPNVGEVWRVVCEGADWVAGYTLIGTLGGGEVDTGGAQILPVGPNRPVVERPDQEADS